MNGLDWGRSACLCTDAQGHNKHDAPVREG